MDNFLRMLKGEESLNSERKSLSKENVEPESEPANGKEEGASSSTAQVAKSSAISITGSQGRVAEKWDDEDAEDDASSYGSLDDRASSFGELSHQGTPVEDTVVPGPAQILSLVGDKPTEMPESTDASKTSKNEVDTSKDEDSNESEVLAPEADIEQAKSLFKLPGTNLVEFHAPDFEPRGPPRSVAVSEPLVTAPEVPAEVTVPEVMQTEAPPAGLVEPEASSASESAVDVAESDKIVVPQILSGTTPTSAESTVQADTQTVSAMAPSSAENTAQADPAASALEAQLDAEVEATVQGLVRRLQEADEDELEGGEEVEWEGDAEEEEDEEEEDDEEVDEDEDDEALLAQQEEFMQALRQVARNAQEEASAEQANRASDAPNPPPAALAPAAAPASGGPRGLGASGLPALPPRREARAAANVVAAPAVAPPPQAEETQEEKDRREKLMGFRVQLLRAAMRLGEGVENASVSQVMYRLRLLEHALGGGRSAPTSVDSEAARIATNLEASEGGNEAQLDLDCRVLVLGKAGSGKTSTIRSILGEGIAQRVEPTESVVELEGVVKGIRLKFIDTPGLYSSADEQGRNVRVLNAVKRYIKKQTPDIVLFFDRFDWVSTALNDLPLFRTITSVFGPSLWYNSMVVLSHGASAPPDDSRGQPIGYDTYLAQRSFVLQQCVRQASGEVRLQVPTALVENHPNCRKNAAGDQVLPNGMTWRSQLLLLCFSSITLNSTNQLVRAQEAASKKQTKKGLFGRLKELIGLKGAQPTLRMGPGGIRVLKPRHNTLPYMLSQLLQPKEPLRMAEDQNAMEEELDDDLLDEDLDFGDEEEDLPPFSRLSNEALEKLSPQQRKEYKEELRERERIIKRQQFREQLRQRREMKRMQPYMKDLEAEQKRRQEEEEEEAFERPPTLLPEIALPPSFDAENPSHRYRSLDNSQWVVRPLLGQQSWDHDPGFDTFSVERSTAIGGSIPAAISGQISKDKNDGSLMLEGNASKWHGEIANATPVTTAGVDIQTMGKDTSYTTRLDHRITNFGRNRTSAGLCLNTIGGILSYGLKLENRLSLGRRGKLSGGAGLVSGKGDRAVGTQLEAVFNHSKDFPLDRSSTTIGASVMEWQKDVSLGVNAATSVTVGTTGVNGRVNLNNRGAGQLSVRFSSNDHLSLALVGLIPVLRHFVGYRLLGMGREGEGV